ncbi:NUDIX domain-containing protein [Haloferax mediterranei ATCC 33500]|uniref:MutT/NUDIX family protein n=1 Tax=Haloferax mediterranei (strain ATCC 33500 / DSM 1411 / JCM 8866 / NBRC 14739 / NCIMB 2177 / R-4) TaxID=523841 RepID=I3R214_HALMT|nr:NUDIX domain-containing protein [Haloferax mediterranei]AFK18274.1 mutT/NUDIX family protein [Haloferax mediterranei ATCC 33500]AHZ22324.1 NUDIX hydrolase [Haloferax mediterranei ATCC 33500]EMA02453.1 mutT/NUDIX family protein [Haloferax mediterranei ATCC 33500]MDX5988364.1 NUDIX domain-containing protein [Haloferax mediterranei ATCC 33500]QCQ74797.1 NUDIX domain-containing protein [Haloferax mediterranei ATCC 33500]
MDQYAYVVNVEGAVARDGKYLLIERAPEEEHAAGVLAFPGGKVEQSPGHTAPIEATARRELNEEVGIEVGAVEYVLSRTFEAVGTQCINVVTLCEYEGGEAHARAPEEVAAAHWLSPEEIRDHDDAPEYLKEDIEDIEAYRRETTNQ